MGPEDHIPFFESSRIPRAPKIFMSVLIGYNYVYDFFEKDKCVQKCENAKVLVWRRNSPRDAQDLSDPGV